MIEKWRDWNEYVLQKVQKLTGIKTDTTGKRIFWTLFLTWLGLSGLVCGILLLIPRLQVLGVVFLADGFAIALMTGLWMAKTLISERR